MTKTLTKSNYAGILYNVLEIVMCGNYTCSIVIMSLLHSFMVIKIFVFSVTAQARREIFYTFYFIRTELLIVDGLKKICSLMFLLVT